MQKNVRFHDLISLNFREIQKEIDDGNLVTIQFSRKIYDSKMLKDIDQFCSINSEAITIRFYSTDGSSFDCTCLQHLTSVKSLCLDGIQYSENFHNIRSLKNLIQLNIGIYDLEEKEFLSWDNLHGISHLCVTATRKGNINLEHLSSFVNLKTLFINGQTKNIQSIGKCTGLTDLSLCISSKSSIEFINSLPKLRKLRFILGGRSNINEILENEIEELEIIRVKGFCSFTNLNRFKKLKRLLIEDQIQLTELDFQGGLNCLEDVKLLNCKTLTHVTGLNGATKLQQLRISKTNIDFNLFIKADFPKSLKILAFYTWKKKVDDLIKEKLSFLGYKDGLEHR